MLSSADLKKISIIFAYLFIGLVIIVNYPSNPNEVLLKNYIVDTLAYFFMTAVFIYFFIKTKMDIFDPIVLISIVYIMMFTIVPIIDIATGEILWFGVYLFDYGIKGTLIAVLGYCMFCFGFSFPQKKASNLRKKNMNYYTNKIITFSVVLWLICFIISLAYIMSSGKNLSYIFTLGMSGNTDEAQVATAALGILSMFTYSLIPTCLIYSNYGNSKHLKVVLFSLTLMIQLVRGFRFIVVIMVLSYVYFFYLKKKKRPSVKIIFGLSFLLIILIGIMGFYRDGFRSGNTVVWSDFNWKIINEAFFGNFRIYKTYYGIIKAVPEMTPYLYGKQMILYTLIMLIPRALWSGKPKPPGREAMVLGISSYAASAGQAYPSIGEYYYEFGIFGVIIFMVGFGYFMTKIKNRYFYSDDIFDLISYSIVVPTTFQLVIRGYTPSNFYLIIFLILPVTLIKFLSKKSN